MAGEILLLDSFDRYTSSGVGSLASAWHYGDSGLPEGRFGGQGAVFTSISNNGDRAYRFTNTFHNAFVMGAAVKIHKLNTGIFTATRNSSDTETITLGISVTGRLQVIRGFWTNYDYNGVVIAEGSQVDALVLGAWHYVEFMVTTGDPEQQRVRVWVDGALVLNAEYITTREVAFDSFGVTCVFPGTHYDDFYVRDGQSRLGEIKMQVLDLIADTSTNEFETVGDVTDSYLAVSENPVDGDVTYLFSETVGQRSIFEVEDLVEDPQNIKAVQVRVLARKEDAGYRSIKTVLQSDASEVTGSENVLPVTYVFHLDIFERNPSGNVWWTKDAINAMTLGFELFA